MQAWRPDDGVSYEAACLASMTPSQRAVFEFELRRERKDPVVASLVTFFLGPLGVQHVYFGNYGWGLLSLLFCWTGVPTVVAFVQLFFVAGQARDRNAETARSAARWVMERVR